MADIWWPDIFETEIIPGDMQKPEAVAIALVAWGNCMTGKSEIPKSFGKVMAELSIKFDLPHDSEELIALGQKIREEL